MAGAVSTYQRGVQMDAKTVLDTYNCPEFSPKVVNIRKWEDVKTWIDECHEAANGFGDEYKREFSPIINKILKLSETFSSLQEGLSAKPMCKQSRRIKYMSENKENCFLYLLTVVLLNRFVTKACLACSGPHMRYSETKRNIHQFLIDDQSCSQSGDQTDIEMKMAKLFSPYYNRRTQLTQEVLTPFWQCLVETLLFKHLASQDFLKRDFSYVSTEEAEQSPWDPTRSYMLCENERSFLAVLYHNSPSKLETNQCKLIGISFDEYALPKSLLWGLPRSLSYRILSKLEKPSKVYLSGVCSSENQSYVFPFSLSVDGKLIISHDGRMQLPSGDGLCLTWLPLNHYDKFWIDIPSESGEPPPPLYTCPIVDEMSTWFIRTDTTFSNIMETQFNVESLKEKNERVENMVQQCRQLEQFNPKQAEQLFTELDSFFSTIKKCPSSDHPYILALQAALDKYDKSFKERLQNAIVQKSISANLLDEVSTFVENLKDESSVKNFKTGIYDVCGMWIIHSVKHFQLLRNSAIEVGAPFLLEGRDARWRMLSFSKTCKNKNPLLSDCMIMDTIIKKCETIIASGKYKNAQVNVGEMLCLYVPYSFIEELWEKQLAKLEQQIQQRVHVLEKNNELSTEDEELLKNLRELAGEAGIVPTTFVEEEESTKEKAADLPVVGVKDQEDTLTKKERKRSAITSDRKETTRTDDDTDRDLALGLQTLSIDDGNRTVEEEETPKEKAAAPPVVGAKDQKDTLTKKERKRSAITSGRKKTPHTDDDTDRDLALDVHTLSIDDRDRTVEEEDPKDISTKKESRRSVPHSDLKKNPPKNYTTNRDLTHVVRTSSITGEDGTTEGAESLSVKKVESTQKPSCKKKREKVVSSSWREVIKQAPPGIQLLCKGSHIQVAKNGGGRMTLVVNKKSKKKRDFIQRKYQDILEKWIRYKE